MKRMKMIYKLCLGVAVLVLLAGCVPIEPASEELPLAVEPSSEQDIDQPALDESMFELAGEFELVHLVVNFPPGTWTPQHTHGALLLVTVLEGELTVRDDQGVEQQYKAGEHFIEYPGAFIEVGNAGDSPVLVAAAALLPSGESLTMVKEGISTDSAPPGPTTVSQNKMAVSEPIGEFELVQLIVDFPSGTWTPSHTHGGMLLVTVLNGEQTVRDDQGNETTYKAGESFIETPGTYLEIGNAGEELTTVSAAALLPLGETLTTVQEGISTDSAPPGPTVLYQHKLAANSVAAQ